MKFVADLHIHSPYSRAVSKEMTLENMNGWADLKGIKVLGTGDFTHPLWLKELKEKLEPAEAGLFKLKKEFLKPIVKSAPAETRFLLTVEVASIYSQGGRVRRIHNLIFAPTLEIAERINHELLVRGANLSSDGRPIIGLSSLELAALVFGVSSEAVIVPAHAWTPWFSLFGSMSGFDSLEECFGAYSKNIFAIETGLSSDPAMNWRLSKLDNTSLISNSDSHSLTRIGREANVFASDLSFPGIMEAIKSRDPKKFLMTIEFFPEEGKYHYDGHRLCGVYYSPEETKKNKGLCSRCGKPVTVGVMNRVEQLADRAPDYRDASRVPFKNLVPLDQIIAEALGVGVISKAVTNEYESLIKKFDNELKILLDLDLKELQGTTRPEIAEAIRRVRSGELTIRPGFDGEYGAVKIFSEADRKNLSQKSLF